MHRACTGRLSSYLPIMLRAALNRQTARVSPVRAMGTKTLQQGSSNTAQLSAFARRHLHAGQQPTPEVLSGLVELTARVDLEDLGFPPDCLSDPHAYMRQVAASHPGGAHPLLRGEVAYMHLYEDQNFSMGVFLLPPGGAIPLHNHPGMHVVSRLMWGSMRVRAFDLHTRLAPGEAAAAAARSIRPSSTAGLAAQRRSAGGWVSEMVAAVRPTAPTWRAALTTDVTLTAPVAPMLVTPSSGNVHEFRAAFDGACAVLDLLTPPYDNGENRDCTYYTELAAGHDWGMQGGPGLDGVTTVLLQEDPANDFGVVRVPFLGVPVDV